VVTLTKHRGLSKAEDEQLHVLPLYTIDETDEFGDRDNQIKKSMNGAIEILNRWDTIHVSYIVVVGLLWSLERSLSTCLFFLSKKFNASQVVLIFAVSSLALLEGGFNSFYTDWIMGTVSV